MPTRISINALSPFNTNSINIKNTLVEVSSNEKFLDGTIDTNFNFEEHIIKPVENTYIK